MNLPSEPWHWSDGSAITFDPTAPDLEIPEDAFVEAEPDADTAELLGELVDLGDVAAGISAVEVTDEANTAEADDIDAATDGSEEGESGGEEGAEVSAEVLAETLERGEEPQGATCLLYTSQSPRDQRGSRMPSSA